MVQRDSEREREKLRNRAMKATTSKVETAVRSRNNAASKNGETFQETCERRRLCDAACQDKDNADNNRPGPTQGKVVRN
ncbi:hypothetical protein J6590_017035 [Homalodisca vitripennis]|nr:hypothetical protein J6590_017035 [Homalodisca vitripennis]